MRDCAQVIRKKQSQLIINPNGTSFEPKLMTDKSRITEENIRDDNNDQLLEYLLGININDPELEAMYKNNIDLGYEWIGGNTHVVIIGDILDGLRSSPRVKSVSTPLKASLNEYVNQYPQIEVKILMFLNKLDELAIKYGGRVFKLIGNHEHLNFTNSESINYYAFGNNINNLKKLYFNSTSLDNNVSALEKKDYYNNFSRREYFNIDKPGYDLFVNRGSGVLLIIDNSIHQYVFCHGTLSNRITYTELNDINKIINNGVLKKIILNIYMV